MVFAAWLAFRAPPAVVDESAAQSRLAFDEPDFQPLAWLFDGEGRAALAEGADGDFALVFRLGADLVTRRFPAGVASATAKEGALIVRPADPGAGPVTLRAAGADDWARKIAAG